VDIKGFEALWNQIPLEEELLSTKEYWELRADEFNEKSGNNCNEIKKILKNKDIDTADMDLLDIGCGPGKCAIELSKDFGRVCGIDISEKMVDYATKNASAANAENIDFMVMPWEKADIYKLGWEERFHVVMALMTPGISSVQALDKMNKASKRACILSSFVHRKDLKMELEEHLGISDYKDPAKNKIYLAFNILWHMGYYPEIFYTDAKITGEYSLKEALNLYEKLLSLSEGQKNRAKEFLKGKMNENKRVVQSYNAKIAWLYWEKTTL
jgi:SAM-dependent methyltransferase